MSKSDAAFLGLTVGSVLTAAYSMRVIRRLERQIARSRNTSTNQEGR